MDERYSEYQNLRSTRSRDTFKGPPMIHARFHHACHVTKIGHKTGLLVVGGLGPNNVGDRVEFMAISNALKEMHWTILPSLNQPHPNQPMIGNLGDHVMVVGGGGFPYPGGENVAEILTNNRWTSFKHVGVDRAFGLAIQVPEIFTEKCEMEPNYGGHHYFKRKGKRQSHFSIQIMLNFILIINLRRNVAEEQNLVLQWRSVRTSIRSKVFY